MAGGRDRASGGIFAGAGAIALVLALAACGGHSGSSGAPPAGPTSTAPSPTSTLPSPTSTSTAGAATTACVNTDATAAVRAALVRTDGRPDAAETPGRLYYAVCGATAYAVDTFEASPAATAAEQVAFQDHGAYPEFFVRHGTTAAAWTEVGSAAGPPGAPSCTAFTQVPAAIRSLWGDCVVNGSTSTTTSTASGMASCEPLASHLFIRITTVRIAGDGSAALGGPSETVSCGGPDDYHFVTGAPEVVHLVAGATVEIVPSPPTGADRALPLRQLGHYVAGVPESGDFEIVGTPAHATGVMEVYRP